MNQHQHRVFNDKYSHSSISVAAKTKNNIQFKLDSLYSETLVTGSSILNCVEQMGFQEVPGTAQDSGPDRDEPTRSRLEETLGYHGQSEVCFTCRHVRWLGGWVELIQE